MVIYMDDKLIIKPKKHLGEFAVVSARMPMELIRRLDEIGNRTGRSRNELINICVDFALDRIEIPEKK